MLIPPARHRWTVTPKRAVLIQRKLAPLVKIEPLPRDSRWVAGGDMALTPDGSRCIAGIVLWDLQNRRVEEEHVAVCPLKFPYVPGLLSFREIPALFTALRKLNQQPDVILLDGQGLAHPRRFGLACHVGVLLDLPSIGCAKSLLCGRPDPLAAKRGSTARLRDGDETVGRVVRTRDHVNPIYVSIGHRTDLESAVELVLACGDGYRVPAPTRLADRLVARVKKEL